MPFAEHPTVLHYVGYDDDRGGIVSVVRALAAADRFQCVLGLNAGGQQRRAPALPQAEFPPVAGESLGLAALWRARAAARVAQAWLHAGPSRFFHGHSRVGLVVALWLRRWGERRVVASVHCYGRHRWFYRWAARTLGEDLFWLSPAMKLHYGLPADSWSQCIPGCVRASPSPTARGPAGKIIRLSGVGALTRWKKWDLIMTALAVLPPAQRECFRFRHIGSTDGSADSARYAAELMELTKRSGLQEIVEWRGEQPSSAALLAETDCLVVASENEPFSVAVLEALGAGVPVLAAKSGGATDVIMVRVNGWFFRNGDASDLARVLESLADGSLLARARIEPSSITRFTTPVVAAQWALVYARLLSGQ
jgi:glycosyltransferase involved in cell wall biosynthesis